MDDAVPDNTDFEQTSGPVGADVHDEAVVLGDAVHGVTEGMADVVIADTVPAC
jgi:hypothetical protein